MGTLAGVRGDHRLDAERGVTRGVGPSGHSSNIASSHSALDTVGELLVVEQDIGVIALHDFSNSGSRE